MLKERREAAQKVADRLFAVENAIDVAIAMAAELNAAMPVARTDARLSAVVGHDAMKSAAASFASLIKARQKMVEAHHQLDATKDQIGLRVLGVGGGMEKPLLPSVGGHLTAVHTAA